MLRLSKKADYALMAMKHLAMRPDAPSASAREIAEQYDIPIELMAKVLQRLAQGGFGAGELCVLAVGHGLGEGVFAGLALGFLAVGLAATLGRRKGGIDETRAFIKSPFVT